MNLHLKINCEVCGDLIIESHGMGDDIHHFAEVIDEMKVKFNDTGFIVCHYCEESAPEDEAQFQDEQYRQAKGFE